MESFLGEVAADLYARYGEELSRRAVLYDLRYCSQEHLLSTDYVVVETTDSGSLKPYAVDGEDGLDGLTALLRAAGYAQLPDTGSRLQLWKRP